MLAAFQWQSANHAIVNELDGIPKEQWTTISYADLVAAPAIETARLCAFMEVELGSRLTQALQKPLPLSATTIRSPSPIKWKSNRAFIPEVVKGLQPLAGRIRSLRVHAAPPVPRSSHLTSIRFACFVDELSPLPTPPDASVAPTLQIQLGSTVPLPLLPKVRHRERFLPDHPLLWVEEVPPPVSGVRCGSATGRRGCARASRQAKLRPRR